MTTNAKAKTNDRRSFLKNGLLLAGSAALAAAGPGRAEAKAPRQSAAASTPSVSGYHETPHILEYYRLAKF